MATLEGASEASPRAELRGLGAGTLGGERRGLVEPGARRGWYVDGRRLRLVPGLWTMKEALVKSYRTGFLLDPTSFEMPAAVRWGATGGRQVDGLGNRHFAAALAPDAEAVPARSGQPAG